MKNNNLFLYTFLIFTSIIFSYNSENLEPDGIKSVQKFLESKQIEYKNSIKNNESVNIEEYKILTTKLSQIKNYKSRDQVRQKNIVKQSKIDSDNILRNILKDIIVH